MTNAVPEQALNTLLEAIISHVDDAEVNTFALARYERELGKLWSGAAVSPGDYHMTRAMLNMLKHNNDAAVQAAREAVRWAGGDLAIQNNCLTVVGTALAMQDAIALIRAIAQRHADNKDAIKDILIKAADLLQFSTAAVLMEKFDKLNVNSASEPKLLRKVILKSKDAMIRHGFSDEDLAARLSVVGDTLRKKNYDVWRSSRTTLDDGTFMYFVHVDADPARCAELNFDIADALVESFENPGVELASFSCRPAADLLHMAEMNPGQL